MKKAITIILVITIILTSLILTSCSQQSLNDEYQATIQSIDGNKVTASVGNITKTIYINEDNMTLGAIGKYEFLKIKAGDIVSIKVSEGRIVDVNLVKQK
jgi:major membrane immunogen (membrane-anchored lipoprotein)